MAQGYDSLRRMEKALRALAWVGAVVWCILSLVALVSGGRYWFHVTLGPRTQSFQPPPGAPSLLAGVLFFLLHLVLAGLHWVIFMGAAAWIAMSVDTNQKVGLIEQRLGGREGAPEDEPAVGPFGAPPQG